MKYYFIVLVCVKYYSPGAFVPVWMPLMPLICRRAQSLLKWHT